ncbi:MAG: methyltransferase domain-containing protein [Erysipelotrichaceae bacterium]|nr:methyltransferase domain-containing protein [Erysipelotrichaceae bacterium]
MKNILYCPHCKNELNQIGNTFKCVNNHSYDISKKGFVNLLLANQHHSDNSGDEKGMILSRVRFLNTGKYDLLRDLITETIKSSLDSSKDNVVCDLGCGEGYYTTYFHNKLKDEFNLSTYGVDLSKQAINECTIRQRQMKLENIKFVIGNLNYLPIQNESVDLIVNSFAKIDENEFLRILRKNGIFLRILPGTKHLLGLKEVLYENVRLNEDKETYIEGFELIDIKESEGNILLNNQEINDLFTMTPYYYKSPKDTSEALMKKEELNTIISFKILVYRKK